MIRLRQMTQLPWMRSSISTMPPNVAFRSGPAALELVKLFQSRLLSSGQLAGPLDQAAVGRREDGLVIQGNCVI